MNVFKNLTFKEFLAPIIMIGALLIFVTIFYFGITTNSHETLQVHRVCGVDNKAKGIDVSYYQSTIDWNIVAEQTDIDFAIARVSDGTYKLDSKFQENWYEIQRVGLIRGAYQFFRPNQDAIAQAELFVTTVNNVGGFTEEDLPPVMDLEVTGGATKEQILDGMYDWIEYVTTATNKDVIIYTGPVFFDASGLGNNFSNYALWTAHYTENPCPWIPDGWNHWEFWQFTGSGTLKGISRPVDINVFNGNLEELKVFIYNSNIFYLDASVDNKPDVLEEDVLDAGNVDVSIKDASEKEDQYNPEIQPGCSTTLF